MSKILWRPTKSRIEDSNADAFRLSVNSQRQLSLANWDALYRWSIEQPEAFWESVWSFCGVIAETQGDTTLRPGARLSDARWFPVNNLRRILISHVRCFFHLTEQTIEAYSPGIWPSQEVSDGQL